MSAQDEFDQLAKSADPNKIVYYVDTIKNYGNASKFQSQVNADDYFNNITNVSLSKKDNTYVQSVINRTDLPTNYVEDTNWNKGLKDTVIIDYTFSTFDSSLFDKIFIGLFSQVNSLKTNRDVVKTHAMAHKFMDVIVSSLCQWKYTSFIERLKAYNQTQSNSLTPNITRAINRITELVGQDSSDILGALRDTCIQSLSYLVERKSLTEFLLTSFKEGSTFKSDRFRYELRNVMFERLILRKVRDSDDDVLYYVKRVLVDLYIISFYPYIHFLYITALMDRFKKEGSFINMRVASSVKIVFVTNLIFALYDKAVTSQISFVGAVGNNQTLDRRAYLMDIITILQTYLQSLGYIQFEDSKSTLGDIVLNLQQLSNDVADSTLTLDQLKQRISQIQLEIRTNLNNFAAIEKPYKRKLLEYNLSLFVLVFIILVTSVLIALQFYLDYVLYGLAGIVFIMFLVKLIVGIIALAKL